MLSNVVILDDDLEVLNFLTAYLSHQFNSVPVSSFDELKRVLRTQEIHCAVMDVHINLSSSLDLLDLIRSLYPHIGIVITTGDDSEQISDAAFRLGADDFVLKSEVESRLKFAVQHAIQIRSSNQKAKALEVQNRYDRPKFFIPDDSKIRSNIDVAIQAVKSGMNLLILGETGTGKDMLARHIHEVVCPDSPFVPINCSAVPNTLAESEFFGYEKGAYTDATGSKPGLIELASSGLLFLDEIGSMPFELQPKLLRAIEDKTIRRIGGSHSISTHFKLICATNNDLENASLKGEFREDLYYRINQVTIKLPSLTENHHLIGAYIKQFLSELNLKNNTNIKLPESEYFRLFNMRWRGNIRQLKNEVERIYLMGPTANLILEGPITEDSLDSTLSRLEKTLIESALDQANYNVSAAAKILRIKRETLQKKMIRLGFQSPRQKR